MDDELIQVKTQIIMTLVGSGETVLPDDYLVPRHIQALCGGGASAVPDTPGDSTSGCNPFLTPQPRFSGSCERQSIVSIRQNKTAPSEDVSKGQKRPCAENGCTPPGSYPPKRMIDHLSSRKSLPVSTGSDQGDLESVMHEREMQIDEM